MSRIKWDMDLKTTVIVLSSGNPGAINVLTEMIKHQDYQLIFNCDCLELYGSELYMLWSDCCDRDYDKMKKALELVSVVGDAGITKEQFFKYVRGNGRGVPFERWEVNQNGSSEENTPEGSCYAATL